MPIQNLPLKSVSDLTVGRTATRFFWVESDIEITIWGRHSDSRPLANPDRNKEIKALTDLHLCEGAIMVDRLSVARGENDLGSPLPDDHEMTIARNFIADLQTERKIGNVFYDTEQHLKHEFRKLGRGASGLMLEAAVEAEIKRLERQATTLRWLCGGLLGVG
jgi:hypothetical protein